ncbi:NAD-dependent epimerase/dehydratase family protein, partial [Algoriphagus aestuarii]|nr:NAD-dependent epimerase/dehydratase family protein [Algoriphagus aestuarii]
MAVVLVAGGTGFIGSYIVRRLTQDGHRVIVMSRDPGKARGRVPDGVEVRAGDVTDGATLGPALA